MSPFPAEPLNTASSGSVSGKWSAPVQPTPEPDTGGEVEALAAVISQFQARDLDDVAIWGVARLILGSGWIAEVRARTLCEAADDVLRGAPVGNESYSASQVAAYLNSRARLLARTAPLQDAEEVGE